MKDPKQSSQEIKKVMQAPSQEKVQASSSDAGSELTESELNNAVGGTGAAPSLMKACATGVHIKEAKII